MIANRHGTLCFQNVYKVDPQACLYMFGKVFVCITSHSCDCSMAGSRQRPETVAYSRVVSVSKRYLCTRTRLKWVVSLFVGFAHGMIMASKLLKFDGIHGGRRWTCDW